MSSVDSLTGQLGKMSIGGLVCAKTNKPVALQSIDVDVSIQGFVASVTSDLTYINKEEEVVGAVFIFPLDEQSAVYHFEAEIDSNVIVAKCQDKTQAHKTFKDATEQGQTAFLLEESGETGDVFECKVGNLPPSKPVKVTFRYVIELSTDEDGSVRFSLPAILNPRHNPSVAAGGSKDVPNVAFASAGDIPYQLNFKGSVTASSGISEVKSDHDSLVWTPGFNDNTTGQLSLASTHKFDHDLAVNVFYRDQHRPFVMLEKAESDKDLCSPEGLLKQDVIMLNFIPDLAQQIPDPEHNEYIFIVDRSGSMQGPRISDAKETLLFFLKSLPIGCYFNIISFGSRFEDLFLGGCQQYSEESLHSAMQLQETMQANFGGTELLKPLKHMYGQPVRAGYPRQVFLLTDGQVWNTKEITSLVEQNSNNTRVFSFGIGAGASTALVKGIARAGKGVAEFITGKERLQAKVMNSLKMASQPALCDIQTRWNIPVTSVPAQPPPMYSGHRLIMYGIAQQEITEHTPVELTITGKLRGDDVTHTVSFNGAEQGVSSGGSQPLHRLCAKAQIKQLEEEEELEEGSHSPWRGMYPQTTDSSVSKRDMIILLSTTANVISRYTSFVGVEKSTKQALPAQGPRYNPVPVAHGGVRIMGCYGSAPPQAYTTICQYASSYMLSSASQQYMPGPQQYMPGPQQHMPGPQQHMPGQVSRYNTVPVGPGGMRRLMPYAQPQRMQQNMNQNMKMHMAKQALQQAQGPCYNPGPVALNQLNYNSMPQQQQQQQQQCMAFQHQQQQQQCMAFQHQQRQQQQQQQCMAMPGMSTRLPGTFVKRFGGVTKRPVSPERERAVGGHSSSDPQQRLNGLVSLQTFKGSWLLDQHFSLLIGVSLNTLQDAAPIKNMEVWATIVALAWLEAKFAGRKDD